MHDVEAIEDAILAALAPLQAGMGLQTLEPLPELPETETEMRQFAARVRQMPAALTCYTGSDFRGRGDRKMETLRFSILVVSKSLRSDQSATRGALAVLREIRQILAGRTLLAGLQAMDPVGDRMLWLGSGITVWATVYEIDQPHLYPVRP